MVNIGGRQGHRRMKLRDPHAATCKSAPIFESRLLCRCTPEFLRDAATRQAIVGKSMFVRCAACSSETFHNP